jgi:hypothetical protein
MRLARRLLVSCAFLCFALPALSQAPRPRPATNTPATGTATKQQTFQFIRGKLLGIPVPGDSTLEVEASTNGDVCSVWLTFEDKTRGLIQFANLDANSLSWKVFEDQNRVKFLVLDMIAKPGMPGEVTYFDLKQPNQGSDRNFARFAFSLTGAAAIPDFQPKMTAAVKHLITLCGGTAEQNLF